MILVDANLLVYAHVETFPQHPRAAAWLDSRLNQTAPVGLPWPSLLAFMRIVTNQRIFARPEPIGAVLQLLHEWLSCPPAWIPLPTHRHADILGPLLAEHAVRPNLIPDAHLAALAIEHGLVLCSTDGDFGRFSGLRWENPIA